MKTLVSASHHPCSAGGYNFTTGSPVNVSDDKLAASIVSGSWGAIHYAQDPQATTPATPAPATPVTPANPVNPVNPVVPTP